jgi:hypothetical protein
MGDRSADAATTCLIVFTVHPRSGIFRHQAPGSTVRGIEARVGGRCRHRGHHECRPWLTTVASSGHARQGCRVAEVACPSDLVAARPRRGGGLTLIGFLVFSYRRLPTTWRGDAAPTLRNPLFTVYPRSYVSYLCLLTEFVGGFALFLVAGGISGGGPWARVLSNVSQWLMRKPIAVKKPLLGPGDWRGIRFGTLASRGQEAAITALGATPVEVLGPRRDEALAAGDLDAFELYLIGYQQNTLAPRAPYVTANVNLWPQVATLIADSDRLSGLTKDQRAWLSRAAGEAVERSRQLANQDAELAAEGCADGARFTNASAADLDALRRAFAPVYAELSKDAQTKKFIDRIEALKASTPREPPLAIPANCPKVVAPTAVVGATNRLDGMYRWTLTVDDARTYGTANDQQHLDDWYPTTFTMKLHRGTCEISQTADPGRELGTFEVNGNRITFQWGTDVDRTFTFTVGTDGTLTLEPVLPMNAGLQFVMTTHPWTKIG